MILCKLNDNRDDDFLILYLNEIKHAVWCSICFTLNNAMFNADWVAYFRPSKTVECYWCLNDYKIAFVFEKKCSLFHSNENKDTGGRKEGEKEKEKEKERERREEKRKSAWLSKAFCSSSWLEGFQAADMFGSRGE